MSDIVAKAPNEVFLNAEEVAERWPIPGGKNAVYRLVREGKLDGVVTKVGRYVVFRLDRLEAWEADGGRGLGDSE
jgi:hypothetical protein